MTRVKILFILPLVAFVGAQLRPTPNRPLRPQVQVLEISSTTTEAPVRTTQKEVTAPTPQAPTPVVLSSSTQRSGYLRSLFARPRPGDSIILPTESSEPSTFAPMITKPTRSFISTQPPAFVSSSTVQLPTKFFPSQPPISTEVKVEKTEADLLITKSPDGFISAKKDKDDTTAKNVLTESTRLPFQESTIPSSPSPITEAEPIFVSKFPLEPTRTFVKPLRTTTLGPKLLITQNDQEPTFTILEENVQNLQPTVRPRPQTIKPFVEPSTTAKPIEITTLEQISPEIKTEDPTFTIPDENIKNFSPTMQPRPQTMTAFSELSTTAKPIETTTLKQILPEVKNEIPTFTIPDENSEDLRPTMPPLPQTMQPFVELSTTSKPTETTTLEQKLLEVKKDDTTFTGPTENVENLRPTMRPRPQTVKPFVEPITTAMPIETITLQQKMPDANKEDSTFTISAENIQKLRSTMRPRPQTVKPFVEPITTAMPIETTTLQKKMPDANKEDSTFTIPAENIENFRPSIRPRPQTMKPFVEPSTTVKPIEDPSFIVPAKNIENPRMTLRPRPQTMKPFVEPNTTARPIETTTLESKRPISFDQENVFITTFRPLTRPTPITLPIQTTTRLPRPRPIPRPDSSTIPPKTTFTPASTISFKAEGCTSGVNAYLPVSNECDTYIVCKKNVATKYSCPDGLHFNRNAVYPDFPCSYPSEVTCDDRAITQPAQPNAECPRQYGFFSRPDGICDSYIMCQGGKAQIMKCPPGLAFNPDKSNCDWPANVPSCNLNVFKGFSCPTPPLDKDGKPSDLIYKFKYGNSCQEYVACHRKHPRLLRCDPGLAFDESSETCIDSDLVPNCSNAL